MPFRTSVRGNKYGISISGSGVFGFFTGAFFTGAFLVTFVIFGFWTADGHGSCYVMHYAHLMTSR